MQQRKSNFSNFKNWLKKECPLFYQQLMMKTKDFEVLEALAEKRKFNLTGFCKMIEEIYSGDVPFTLEIFDIFLKSKIDGQKVLESVSETIEIIDEKDTIRYYIGKSQLQEDVRKGFLVPIQLPDRRGRFFIKKHAALLKEIRKVKI